VKLSRTTHFSNAKNAAEVIRRRQEPSKQNYIDFAIAAVAKTPLKVGTWFLTSIKNEIKENT
jgi:hypothetical protein